MKKLSFVLLMMFLALCCGCAPKESIKTEPRADIDYAKYKTFFVVTAPKEFDQANYKYNVELADLTKNNMLKKGYSYEKDRSSADVLIMPLLVPSKASYSIGIHFYYGETPDIIWQGYGYDFCTKEKDISTKAPATVEKIISRFPK